jgi:hypothetical protein
MPLKNKTLRNEYHKNYYHNHPALKSISAARVRLTYWRKKYASIFNCSFEDCSKLTEMEMREDIKNGTCRI